MFAHPQSKILNKFKTIEYSGGKRILQKRPGVTKPVHIVV
jgi:hypothetical protein